MQVDVALDIVGHADTPNIALACLNCLKRNGILVLDGSMDCPLPIPYGMCTSQYINSCVSQLLDSRSAADMLLTCH